MEKNFNKKNKFIENTFSENFSLNGGVDMHINKQPFYDNLRDVNMNDIVKNNYNTRNKSQLELKDTLDPYDYELPYNNAIKKDIKGQEEFVYYSPYDQGPGRGFGNLNVNNTIRNSESSRLSSEDFKLYRESEIIDRFDFIDNRYTNPKNVVFPFPRSGEMTRKNELDDEQTLFADNINKYNFNTELTKQKYSVPVSNSSLIESNIPEIDYSNINLSNESKSGYIMSEAPKPNNNLIVDINNKNEEQRRKQEIYMKKLKYVESVIAKLKLQYGASLTKEMISEYITNNPPEKYIASIEYSKNNSSMNTRKI